MARAVPARIVDHKGNGYMRNFKFSSVLKFHKYLGETYPKIILRDFDMGVAFQLYDSGPYLSAEVLQKAWNEYTEKV